MADGTIDKLSIEISASSNKAAEDIKKTAESLKALKTAAQSVSSAKTATANMFKGMSADSVQAMSKIDLLRKKLDALKSDLSSKMSLGKINDKGIANAALQIKSVQAQIDKTVAAEAKAAQKAAEESAGGKKGIGVIAALNPASDLMTSMKQIGRELSSSIKPGMQAFGNMLKSAAGHAAKIAKSFLSFAGKTIKNVWDKSAFKGLENSLARIKKIISSFGRIAFYRAIRSAIKYVTDALKEGTENAYHFAREFGDATTYIADAYDRLSSANFKMSNQLGAAWATLIAAIEPIIIQIINLVTRAADAITQLFALLSGKGTYLKAVDYNKQWAESAGGAAKAAKEWKNQLMGFDEINRLEAPSEPSGGGGGGKPTDYNNMFEETPVSKFFEDIKKAFDSGEWAQLGKLMGNKFNEIVNSVDWNGLGKRFGTGLQAMITMGYNFLKAADFVNIGTKISEFVNSAMKNIDFTEAGRLWMRFRTILWDVIYGAVVSLDWSAVATALSNYILGALTELSEWLETLDPAKIATALKDFFGNIKYKEIGEKIKEVVKKAFGVLGDTVKELLPDDLGDEFKDGIANAIKKADFKVIHNVLAYKLDEVIFGEEKARKMWYNKGEFAGRDLILGTEYGVQQRGNELDATLKSYVTDPVSQALYDMEQSGKNAGNNLTADISVTASNVGNSMGDIRNSIDDVTGAAWSMSASGRDAMAEMNGAVYRNSQNMIDNLGTLRNAAMNVWGWLTRLSDAGAARIEANGGIWNSLGGFATGGFPEDGLFFANHNELVGGFANGRTAVANNEMIVEGISAGVFNAVTAAFAQTGGGGGDRPIVITLDGKEIARTTTRYQNQAARAGAY